MCTALRELVEDAWREGFEQGWREGFKQGWREGLEQAEHGLEQGLKRGLKRGKREEKQLCYLRALKLPLTPKEARAVAGISEKEAWIALQLREQGKI